MISLLVYLVSSDGLNGQVKVHYLDVSIIQMFIIQILTVVGNCLIYIFLFLGNDAPKPSNKTSCKCEKNVHPNPIENTFTYRHVKNLLSILSLDNNNNNDDVYKFDLVIELSKLQVATLQRYVSQHSTKKSDKERLGQMHDVDSILNTFIVSAQPTREYDLSDLAQDYTSRFKQYLPNSSQDVFWSILFCAGLTLFYLMWIGVPIWKLFVLMLVISSLWHWGHMYKKAVLKKQMVLMESHDVPHECFKEKSWKDYFFDNDKKCKDYHSALLVDPLWEVTPTMAIAETITVLLVQPLEQLGTHLGIFFSSLLANLSWLSAVPVLIFVFMLIFVVIIMMCGYKIRLPFLLASIEPQSRVEPQLQTLHLEQKVQELQIEISQMKDSKEALATSTITTHSVKQVAMDSSENVDSSLQNSNPQQQMHSEQRTVVKVSETVKQVSSQPVEQLILEDSKYSLLEQKIEQLQSTISKLEFTKKTEIISEATKVIVSDSAQENTPFKSDEVNPIRESLSDLHLSDCPPPAQEKIPSKRDEVNPIRQALSDLSDNPPPKVEPMSGLTPDDADSSRENNPEKPEESFEETKARDVIPEEQNGCDFEWVNS